MTPTQRVGDLWKSPWWLVVGVAFTVGGVASSQLWQSKALAEGLAQKAEKTSVERLERKINALLYLACLDNRRNSICAETR